MGEGSVLLYQKIMAVVGFEPAPPERLEPKSSALDRSATLPRAQRASQQSLAKLEWTPVITAAVGFQTNGSERLEPREPASEAGEVLEMLRVRANHVPVVQRLHPLSHPDCTKSTL